MRHYYAFKLTGSIILAIMLAGCANAIKPATTTSKIPAFKLTQQAPSNKIRLVALREAAISVGAQAGLSWRYHQINNMLTQQSKFLTKIFDFQALMLPNNVMPPVLEESTNTLNLASNSSIRLADRTYQIVAPARFITAVPSWRDYLWKDFPPPSAPDASLLPKSNAERDIWNRNVTVGWDQGIEQAQQIFKINLHRLQRDYQGMILYRKLLAQNIVTPPYVSKANLGITGGGNSMRVNDRVLRITAVSKLQANSRVWKSRISAKYPVKAPKRKLRKKVKRVNKSTIKAYG